MLGDKIIDNERGKIVGTRVISSEGFGPKVELTFQSAGKILGVEFNNLGTLASVPRPGGVFFEEGQGIVSTVDGEMAPWIYHGIGTPTGHGLASSHRGSIFFQTSSEKLARLNNMCVVVAVSIDENGNMLADLWEWK